MAADNGNGEGHSIISIEERGTRLELYKAALSNKWSKAERIYRESGLAYGEIITSKGETALHVAALEGHFSFVLNLAEKMNENEIMIETEPKQASKGGNTAFHYAAISGHVYIAQAITRKANLDRLALMRGDGNFLPVEMAALRGNKKMVKYLYKATRHYFEDGDCTEINGQDRKALFTTLINAELFDVALEMANGLIDGGIAPENMEEEALEVLARKPLNLLTDNFIFLISDAKDRHIINNDAIKLIKILWSQVASDVTRVRAFIESSNPNPIFEAARCGNSEFLFVVIASHPDVLLCTDKNGYTIFHHAILNRHGRIFKLLKITSFRKSVISFIDEQGNNMLHLVAKLPPPDRLNNIAGPALQLQREILWFEEVKKMMEPHEVNRKNHTQGYLQLRRMLQLIEEMRKVITDHNNSHFLFKNLKMVIEQRNDVLEENSSNTTQLQNVFLLFEEIKMVMEQHELNQNKVYTKLYTRQDSKLLSVIVLFKEMRKVMEQYETKQNNEMMESCTPLELFEKEHKELMIQGKIWMKDVATSCMVVAALIVTISFAAAITVPGGNADNGYPNFQDDENFLFFVFHNWTSFLFSSASLLTFLSTFTSTSTLRDFRWSFPLKLSFGILSLGISTIGMLLACYQSFIIILKEEYRFMILLTSNLPTLIIFASNLQMYINIISSTYQAYTLFTSKTYPPLIFE